MGIVRRPAERARGRPWVGFAAGVVLGAAVGATAGVAAGAFLVGEDRVGSGGPSGRTEEPRLGTFPSRAAVPTGGGCAEAEARARRAEQEAALALGLVRSLERELFGEPRVWGDDVPEHHDEASFRQAVGEMVAECGEGVDVVAVECEEPPCMVAFRVGFEGFEGFEGFTRLVQECAPWKDRYGDRATLRHQGVECGDGRTEGALVLAPFPPVEREESENLRKRSEARWREMEHAWRCRAP